MAINKKELIKSLTTKQKKEVALLETRIDAELREKYVPGGMVTVDLNGMPNERVQKELIKRYQTQGWNIAFHSDQRDGNCISLS